MHDKASGCTACIDTPEVGPTQAALDARGWKLTHIFNTHHHSDHTGGNLALKRLYNCVIVGPKADAERIPGIDQPVSDGERVKLGAAEALVLHTPGHTRGHCSYYFESAQAGAGGGGGAAGALFCGDTLFSMGCGRLFEGSRT